MISMIVPLAPGDESWRVLLQDIAALEERGLLAQFECLFMRADDSTLNALQIALQHHEASLVDKVRLCVGGGSRAESMNAGAQQASGEYLWFVHADSRLSLRHIQALQQSLVARPVALHYFNLKFYGHRMMWLNAFGVWLRSHLFMSPFGDQALCLSAAQFAEIGGYPDAVPYGEDHLLVWRAMQQGIKLRCTGAALSTSARKYASNGWARTTGLHLRLWAKQAWPEFVLLLQKRWLNKG